MASAGLSIGLYQLPVPQLAHRDDNWHPHVRTAAEQYGLAIMPAGEPIDATLVVAHSPWLFIRKPRTAPAIRSRFRVLVVHALPTDARGRLLYDPWTIDRNARQALGGSVVWAPISGACRASLDRTGMPFPRLIEDWTNVIFVDDWGKARKGLLGVKPIIGRHSLARPEKWPDSLEVIRQAYCPGGGISVRLMGVHDSVLAVAGGVPSNWKIYSVNEIPVREFLGSIDFFVYYHHRDWIETFGRAPAEAIAAGCVAILPPYFEATFGTAAVYCDPRDVIPTIERIAAVPQRFADLSRRGREEVDFRYGPAQHLQRLKRVLAAARTGEGLLDLCTAPTSGLPSRTAIALARAGLRVRERAEKAVSRPRRWAGRLKAALARKLAPPIDVEA